LRLKFDSPQQSTRKCAVTCPLYHFNLLNVLLRTAGDELTPQYNFFCTEIFRKKLVALSEKGSWIQ